MSGLDLFKKTTRLTDLKISFYPTRSLDNCELTLTTYYYLHSNENYPSSFVLFYEHFDKKLLVSKSVTRILSPQIDTMTLIFRDEMIENNFTKLTFTKAKCKECSNTFTHTFVEDFRMHMQTHKNIFNIEENQKSEPSWKYIRLHQIGSGYHCVLCKEDIQTQSLELYPDRHIHDTDEYSLEGNYYEEWQSKYCVVEKNDSEVKCYICEKKISIDFRKDFLMYHLREYHIQLPPRNIRDIEVLNISEEIKKNFIIFSNHKAECTTCNHIYTHMPIEKFIQHVRTCHKEIANHEDQKRSMLSWRYMKYCQEGEFQCVLCTAKVTDEYDCNHIHANDSFTSMGKSYELWELKYCERINNYKMQCDICKNIISLNFYKNHLTEHIKWRCNDQISKKRRKIDELMKHFEESSKHFSNVKCRYCNLEFQYIGISIFHNHLEDKHKHILKFEKLNANSEFEISCRNLKYVNDLLYKCDICHQPVLSDALSNHGCKDESNTAANDKPWQWKYYVRMNDFVFKCVVCPNRFDIEFLLEESMVHIKICPMPRNTTEMFQYFQKISHTKAICTLCLKSGRFIFCKFRDIKLFPDHIKERHPEIFQFETENQSRSWKYLKYVYGAMESYDCVLCNADNLYSEEELNDHVHNDDKYSSHPLYYEDWPWKYCTKLNESSVKCDVSVCMEEISIENDISPLRDHLKLNHIAFLESTRQETYKDIASHIRIAGPSGSSSKRQKRE